MADLDLRKLRYFLAVADELHFGRAAEALHIAQPVLSRQIRVLEQDLGASLFTRDRHGVALTDAGRQLLADAGQLLASAEAVRHRVTEAARGGRRVAVGFRTGIPVIPAARAFEARHPDVVVDVQRIEWDDQAPMLLDGRIDVGYVRLPIDETGLRVIPLYTEPLMVVLPAGHRLAGKEEVTEADLAGEPLVWHADPSTQPTRRPLPDSGLRVRAWRRSSSTSRPAGASRSWGDRRRSSTHVRTSATSRSRSSRPTRCASRWRRRAPRRWPTTSSPRRRRRPRSRRNAGTTRPRRAAASRCRCRVGDATAREVADLRRWAVPRGIRTSALRDDLDRPWMRRAADVPATACTDQDRQNVAIPDAQTSNPLRPGDLAWLSRFMIVTMTRRWTPRPHRLVILVIMEPLARPSSL